METLYVNLPRGLKRRAAWWTLKAANYFVPAIISPQKSFKLHLFEPSCSEIQNNFKSNWRAPKQRGFSQSTLPYLTSTQGQNDVWETWKRADQQTVLNGSPRRHPSHSGGRSWDLWPQLRWMCRWRSGGVMQQILRSSVLIMQPHIQFCHLMYSGLFVFSFGLGALDWFCVLKIFMVWPPNGDKVWV